MIGMSKRKNEELMKSIMNQNFCNLSKAGIKSAMMHQEVAGQRVFYVFLKQHGYDINPEDMDKCQSDGIIGNCIIECKLNEDEGGGPKKAYQELYNIIPNRLKSKGLRVPYYRIYIKLEDFKVEVYSWNSCIMIDSFDWYENPEKFKQYFEDKENLYSYDLSEEAVDLVEVIQDIYTEYNIKDKLEAYKILEAGVKGWFKPFDIKRVNVNKLILNNDKMNEKYVQKVQGAFFTPSQYVKISTEYVLKAIEESTKDGYDDYVIIDRCAGVGNLESMFPIDMYSHMILGTINSAEALTANIRFNGLCEVVVQDALSREGVLLYKEKIEEYKVKNKVKKLAVIFLENPPYLNVAKLTIEQKKDKNTEKTYIQNLMKENKLNLNNIDKDYEFIWSCFEIYKPYRYIHYGPIKSWKSKHLIDKEVKNAYLCNRKYFNASEAAIALISWTNKDKENKYIDFDSEIDNKKYRIKKVHNQCSQYYIGTDLETEKEKALIGILIGGFINSSEHLCQFICDADHNDFTKFNFLKIHWISKDNMLKVLPCWVAGQINYSRDGKNPITGEVDFRYIDTEFKTSDGGTKYQKDNKFLQDCLLYTICSGNTKFKSDGLFYKTAEEELDEEHKSTDIYKLYKSLVEKTGLNGLRNIKKYKANEYGELYIEGMFGPSIDRLKKLLSIYEFEVLRPKMLEYELLK